MQLSGVFKEIKHRVAHLRINFSVSTHKNDYFDVSFIDIFGYVLQSSQAVYAGAFLWCTYTEHLMHEISDLMQGFTFSQVINYMVT